MKGCLFTIMTFFCLAVFGVCILRGINFNVECKGHLKRAADANTIELAKQELDIALSYLEREGMTEGYTSVLYKTPDEDVGFLVPESKICIKRARRGTRGCQHP